VKFSTKWGAKQGASQKSGGPKIKIHASSRSPLDLPLGNTWTKYNQLPATIWNFYNDVNKLLQADDCIMITSN